MFGKMDIFMKTNTHLRELNPPPKKKTVEKKNVLSIFGCQVSSYGQSATSGELKFCKDAGLWYWQSSMPASYHPPNGGDGKGIPPKCVAWNNSSLGIMGNFCPDMLTTSSNFLDFLAPKKLFFFF